jgi:CheY-like chemotaxis protein/Flp pilus assembly protein TadD
MSSSSAPRVLIFDRNVSSRTVLEHALNQAGFEVQSASDTEAFEFLAERERPDAFVLDSDVNLEEGRGLVQNIRAKSNSHLIPVVMLTGLKTANFENLHVDDVIQTPTFGSDVAVVLQTELKSRLGDGVVTFDCAQLRPEMLLRALLSAGKSGRINLADGLGTILFSNGKLTSARLGKLAHLEAAIRSLAITETQYNLVFEAPTSKAFDCDAQRFASDVLPRVTNFQKIHRIPLEDCDVVDFRQLASVMTSLPVEVHAVIKLLDGHRSNAEVIIDSPHDERTTSEILRRLRSMHVTKTSETASVLSIPKFLEADGLDSQALSAHTSRQLEEMHTQTHAVEPVAPRMSVMDLISPIEAKQFDAAEASFFESNDAAMAAAPQARGRSWKVWALVAVGGLGAVLAIDWVARTPSSTVVEKAQTVSEEKAPISPMQETTAVAAAPIVPEATRLETPVAMPVETPVAAEVQQAAAVVAKTNVVTPEIDVAALVSQGKSLYERERYKKAIAVLEKAVEIDASNIQAHTLLALTRYDLGDSKGARLAADRVLQLDPSNARIQILVATLYFDANQVTKGRAALEKYLKLEPRGAFAAEAKSLLKR